MLVSVVISTSLPRATNCRRSISAGSAAQIWGQKHIQSRTMIFPPLVLIPILSKCVVAH